MDLDDQFYVTKFDNYMKYTNFLEDNINFTQEEIDNLQKYSC
jgi:hypothetical protein